MVALGVERRVARHEEVEVGRGDEGRDQADQVVVHVRGVPAIDCATVTFCRRNRILYEVYK